jgi:hypothetical protein
MICAIKSNKGENMAPKKNLIEVYDELVANIKTYTPESFEAKIASVNLPEKTKIQWIKENHYRLIAEAILQDNCFMVVYFFNQLKDSSRQFLQFDHYKFLSIAFCQKNLLIFNFLFQRISPTDKEHFFMIRGLFLFKFAFKENLVRHIEKLFEIDSRGIGTYIRFNTYENLLTIIRSQHDTLFEIYFNYFKSHERMVCLREKQSLIIKECIKHSRTDILKIIFQFEPCFFQNLNTKEITHLFEFIALESSPTVFRFIKDFINPKYIEKTYGLVSKDFFKKLYEAQKFHVFEYLMIAAPEIDLFNLCFDFLSQSQDSTAKAIIRGFIPIRQCYHFLTSLIAHATEVPDDLDLLKISFDTFKQEQKIALIQKYVFHQTFKPYLQNAYHPFLMAIGAKHIRRFELKDDHPIHPFFPIITQYYYPLVLNVLKDHLRAGGKLIYFVLNFVSELNEVTHDSLRAFPEYPYLNFTTHFIATLVQQKNHVLYRELPFEQEDEDCKQLKF